MSARGESRTPPVSPVPTRVGTPPPPVTTSSVPLPLALTPAMMTKEHAAVLAMARRLCEQAQEADRRAAAIAAEQQATAAAAEAERARVVRAAEAARAGGFCWTATAVVPEAAAKKFAAAAAPW